MKGLDREELGYFEILMKGSHGCEGTPPRFVDGKEWDLLNKLVRRGILEMFMCPSGAQHHHFRVTKLGLDVYQMQKLAGPTQPK